VCFSGIENKPSVHNAAKIRTQSQQYAIFANAMNFNLLHFLAVYFAFTAFPIFVGAQDLIFMREDDEILECIILQTSDTSIVFRLMDPQDEQEYEVLSQLTYGFLLESEAISKGLKSERYQFEFYHTTKKRRPLFREGNSVLFRLANDTSAMPRRARIIELGCDSIVLETRKKRIPHRIAYSTGAFREFGYTTPLTEALTLLIAPVSALKDGSFFFYRKLNLQEGWGFNCNRAPDEVSRLILKRYPKKIKRQRLPKTVRKKSRIFSGNRTK
jgi:hypothetical protein